MSRAKGRHTQRQPVIEQVDPDSPLGHQLGMSTRTQGVPSPIPGGRPHISNAPVGRQEVPVARPGLEIDALNAHGVPPGSATTRERAEIMRGPNTHHRDMPKPEYETVEKKPTPIPVYVVEDSRGAVFRTAAPHNFTVPGNTTDPVRICGRDKTRTEVMIMNESTAQNIRIAQRPADLTNGGGALIPWPANAYFTFKTQDELYALSTSGTAATVSVVQIFERGL